MTYPLFRIYEGGELATASVRLPEVVPVEAVAEQLEQVSQSVGSLGCSFALEESLGTALIRFVNYPRAKYGERTQRTIQSTATRVARSLGGSVLPPSGPLNTSQLINYAVIGLRYGYEDERIADPNDIMRAIRSKRVPQLGAKLIHVLSVTPENSYTEPALALSFKNRAATIGIARAAHTFQQERFSLEVPLYKRVFMIETPHCVSPDTMPYVRKTATGIPQYVFTPRRTSV